ncbi:hypothetical protein V6Z12_A06G220900 [Gossypium hirsutum]
MVKTKHYFIILFISFTLAALVHAQNQTGFISLDCGLPAGSSYIDSITGMNYTSDEPYIQTGTTHSLSRFNSSTQQQFLENLRSFPQGVRHCYQLNLTKGEKYLIRAKFDLYLGPNLWASMVFENSTSVVVKEIIHVVKARFPEDIYDRVWQPYRRNDLATINSSSSLIRNSPFDPPLVAMMTASIPMNGSQTLNFTVRDSDPDVEFYFYMHVVELEELQANQTREFNIYLNDNLWYGRFSPTYLRGNTTQSSRSVKGGQFSMESTRSSTHPPIINAFEAYKVKELVESQTVEREVNAMMNIKSMYGLKKNWEGDPCAPRTYSWEGLDCSYEDSDPPRIISLDLSNNNLTGGVPEFLTRLQFLTLINLQGNALNGSVPAGLIDRINIRFLQLNLEGNQIPCTWESCTTGTKTSENSVVVTIVASVASVLSIVIIVSALLWWFKRTKTSGRLKNRQFTYSDIQRITNNFEKVLGKGGFGTVYHGFLDDNQVAVKMLSKTSFQGYKQFEAEVELLLRVHHRNLTALIGYCDDGTETGLIYEFMAKGNLAEYLSDSSISVLNWEGRLGIALEAAQGLEYLNHGCKPPIIHRDVKSSNILLTDNLQAKLSDFGLSKSFEGGSHVSTVVAGTPGYLDPEYSTTNRLTEKSDVYSFGVVLLEIITNRPVIARTIDEPTHISRWVSSMLSNGDIENIVDSRLKGDFEINSVWRAIEVAMACLSPASTKRPTMNHVVTELSECLVAEINRTRGVDEDESRDMMAIASLNCDSDIIPLPR